MRLLRFGAPGQERPGVLDREGVVRDLSPLTKDIDASFLSAGMSRARDAIRDDSLPAVASVGRIGAPVARPGKIVGIGLNYADHAAEAGVDPPSEAVVFLKASSSTVGPYDDIELPRGSTHTDWEVEVGVVIGRTLRRAGTAAVALDAVAGYVTANDLTERALAKQGPTWAKGKCHDTFCPVGPWLVTPDEVPDPQGLDLKLWVNGDLRQCSSTKQMIFGVGEQLRYLSDLMRLCCVVRSQAMPRRDLGAWAGQMAGLSSSNAVANRNTGVASTASS